MALDEREARELTLTGDETAGGGLPLPAVFTSVVQDLLDYGPADIGRMEAVVTASMRLKERRVIEVWGSWTAFTRAILDQLQDDGILVHSNQIDVWMVFDGFTLGTRYPVMSGKKQMSIVVHSPDARARRENRAAVKMLVIEFAARLRRLGGEGERLAVLANEWADDLTDRDVPLTLPPHTASDVQLVEVDDDRDGKGLLKNKPGRRKEGVLGRVFDDFWKLHDDGEWHTLMEVSDWHNALDPEHRIEYRDAGSWRRRANILVINGQMEVRQPGSADRGRNNPKEYRIRH